MGFTTEFIDSIKDKRTLALLIKRFISETSTEHIKFIFNRYSVSSGESYLSLSFDIIIEINEPWFDTEDHFNKGKNRGCCYQPYFKHAFYDYVEEKAKHIFNVKSEWNNNRSTINIILYGIDHNLLLALEKENEQKKRNW